MTVKHTDVGEAVVAYASGMVASAWAFLSVSARTQQPHTNEHIFKVADRSKYTQTALFEATHILKRNKPSSICPKNWENLKINIFTESSYEEIDRYGGRPIETNNIWSEASKHIFNVDKHHKHTQTALFGNHPHPERFFDLCLTLHINDMVCVWLWKVLP